MASKKITNSILTTILSSKSSFSALNSFPLNHYRFLTSSQHPNNINININKTIDTKLNFSLSDSDSDSDADENHNIPSPHQPLELPPPYDPFSTTPVAADPKDLQEIFHKMRTEGMFDSTVKMLDGLSKDGLTHEALEIFRQVKHAGQIPEVVSHTAVVEAYANSGRPKEALKTFLRMLAGGVLPNAYTYSVLLKGLAADPKYVGDAKKFILEMMERGVRPNVGVCVAVFMAMVRDEREEDAREILGRLRERGYMPEEKDVRAEVKGKRGLVVRGIMRILFDK